MRRPHIGLCLPAMVLFAGSQQLFAHESGPHTSAELWYKWPFEPAVLIPVLVAAWLYARGVCRLWACTHVGCGIRRWETFAFASGWLALFMALASPLHPWGQVLFSAHMTQHEMLMLVAAPLMVLGKPLIAFLKALPRGVARAFVEACNFPPWQTIWSVLRNPFVAWLVHAIALWIWHLPSLFQATIGNEFIHALQHVSFFASALLFWWAVMHDRRRAAGYGMAVVYMFTTAMHSGLLGALITFAPASLYPVYQTTTQPWGLTPLEDQQLGGLIMWIPAGMVYVIAGLAFFAGWMRESESRARKHKLTISPAIPVL